MLGKIISSSQVSTFYDAFVVCCEIFSEVEHVFAQERLENPAVGIKIGIQPTVQIKPSIAVFAFNTPGLEK